MMGYGFAARLLCAVLLVAVLDGTLAQRSPNFRHRMQGPPLPLPRFVPPFSGPPGTQDPATLDPYACLPRYLCIVTNKKGEKRTTIVHGLHPALRKSKPNVIDPATLPKVTGGAQPVPQPLISNSGTSEEDGIYRDREFNDSFLQQQEKAEAMAFLEEKRRQFLYQQGLPKSKIITKGGQKKPVDDEEKDSNEDEEADKSQEISKEEKEGEAGKSVEASKEDKEETDKSAEVSKEDKEEESDKSVELSKEEQEEDSAEEDGSSEKSGSKLSKYKIKKSKRKGSIKARMDDYDDSDSGEDGLATVPWNDRLRNDTDPLKPSEIYDKLFKNVLPSFQLPSLKKVARKIPGMSFLAPGSDEVTTTTTTTTTTQRPWLFKRMLNRVTGKGADTPAPPIRRRNGSPFRRYKRDASEKLRLISDDEKIVKEIKDPEKQCRMIFKGCDLPYDHIMRMVSRGQVLIENDYTITTTAKPVVVNPAFAQDDEADQAVKDKVGYLKKSPKPIPQLLAHSNLGGKKKNGKPGGKPFFGKNKNKPMLTGSSEESAEPIPFNPNTKKGIPSLPLIPMKYQWGKPTYKFNGKPNGVSDFSGGITERVPYKAPPTTTTTSTTPRPIFGAVKLDFRDNLTQPQLQHSVIRVNRTHAVHVLSKKPYNPPKTRTRDAKGQPASFNSVFTEIAGATGGIHDFFDRISGAFGGDGTGSGRDFASTFPGSNKDVHGNVELFPVTQAKRKGPPPLPPLPSSPPQPPLKSEDGNSDERDEEDSASEEEDQEENKETGNENAEDQDEEDEADNKKNSKNPEQEEDDQDQDQNQEESEEDAENDEGGPDIADDVPPHIRQAMIEDYNRKKHEQAEQNGGDRPGGPPPGPGGPPPPRRGGNRPGLRLPHNNNNGRPGQRPPPKGPPPKRGGGFLSSLFSS